MAEKSRDNVEVGYAETEVIESTATDTHQLRKFDVTNGDKEIMAIVYRSDDNVNWIPREQKNISANSTDIIELDINHNVYIKLMSKTISIGDTSIVDATFTYTPK
jgi:hypothetical protein